MTLSSATAYISHYARQPYTFFSLTYSFVIRPVSINERRHFECRADTDSCDTMFASNAVRWYGIIGGLMNESCTVLLMQLSSVIICLCLLLLLAGTVSVEQRLLVMLTRDWKYKWKLLLPVTVLVETLSAENAAWKQEWIVTLGRQY